MEKTNTLLSLVVPVFNEQEAIPLFHSAVQQCNSLSEFELEIIFINDGSSDHTEQAVKNIIDSGSSVVLINFSRNFGKEPALFAGLEHASGDAVIPIDVDLQDPIEVIPKLVKEWQQGFDMVLAKRVDRSTDHWSKRVTASWFYKVHNAISNPKLEENVGDFRLMSRNVVDAIIQMPERHLFMKGILSWAGFSTTVVEYERPSRIAGDTKFNGWKLWNLALEGLTSFSTVPLRIWTYTGIGVALIALLYAFWMILNKIIWGNPVPGYPSLMTAILFLGGIQLIGIGVLGEYIGRIYMEAKQRPRYIIKNIVKNNAK